MIIFLFVLVVILAGAFAFLNGFRDASAAVALAVRTRALTPTVSVLLAAFFNFVGAGLSAALTFAVSQAWVQLPKGGNGLSILIAGLASAVLWGLYTWWRGIPSSSTHALVGGLAGAGADPRSCRPLPIRIPRSPGSPSSTGGKNRRCPLRTTNVECLARNPTP